MQRSCKSEIKPDIPLQWYVILMHLQEIHMYKYYYTSPIACSYMKTVYIDLTKDILSIMSGDICYWRMLFEIQDDHHMCILCYTK